MKSLRMLGAALLLLGLGACAGQVGEDDTVVGRLDVPLVSTGSGGTQFALAGTFDLVGPETITTAINAADMDFLTEDVLTLSPRVGSYDLTLTGWQLYRVNAAMTPPITAVTGAVLTSAATQAVQILNSQTTNVVYAFNVPGSGTVVFARGTLNIDFTVGEGFPDGSACTASSECQSLVCNAADTCAAASCTDGVQNGSETAPDCGPLCACGGAMGQACDPAVAGSCPVGLSCVGDAAMGFSCQAPTAPTACNAAEAASCPAGDTCSVVAGMVTCSTLGPVACTGTQFATCPSDATCSVVAGMVTCAGGSAIDPMLEACVLINELSTAGATGVGSDEYVELINGCNATISLAGARLVYRSASGTSNTTLFNMPTGAVIAGQGFTLYAGASFPIGMAPAVDGSLSSGLSAAGGGVALMHSGTTVDSVGYGTATNAFIEGEVAPAPLNGESISRIPIGLDSQSNSIDFRQTPRTPRFE